MAVSAKLFISDPAERRAADRRPLDTPATIRAEANVPLDAVVYDLSTTGCLVETTTMLPIGSTLRIGIAGIPITTLEVVRSSDRMLGCEFLTPLTPDQVATAGTVGTLRRLDITDYVAAPAPAPVVDTRWSLRRRLVFIAGTSVTLWTAILLPVLLF
jgi:hypothetical protein